MEKSTNKKITLWEGYEVELNLEIAKDFDYVKDVSEARRERDIATIVSLYFVLIGGEEVFNAVRTHIIEETGYFSTEELFKYIDKIEQALPKDGSRVPKRYGKSSK